MLSPAWHDLWKTQGLGGVKDGHTTGGVYWFGSEVEAVNDPTLCDRR